MSMLITFIVLVLLLCVAYWAVHKIAATFGLAPQIVVVLDVAMVIIGIVLILRVLGLWSNVVR